jgi:phosphatidylglycerol lysyltransferase
MRSRSPWITLLALVTLGSGILNIASVVGPGLPGRLASLGELFPIEFIHLSRSVVLLIGFTLVLAAINIYRRKRRALQIVLALSCLSVVFHLTKGIDYEEAAASLLVVVMLLAFYRHFTVQSSIPSFGWGLVRIATAMALAFAYGVAGFWFLDHGDFHREFHIADAVGETLRYLTLVGDAALVPHTHYARWFLDSLYLFTGCAMLYGIYSVFRPALYRFRTVPRERVEAKRIVEQHGRSSLDFFKYWHDKSYVFSASRRSFVAYHVGGHFALALADPVGPENETEATARAFVSLCEENDWHVCFYQTLPDFLPAYERLGFHRLKIGDDAVIDLAQFSLEGKQRKELRHSVNKLESDGLRFVTYAPPLNDEVLFAASRISEEWLAVPGRRERTFTLGQFEPDYVRATPLHAAVDKEGRMLAFLNEIPSYGRGEATIDLMRYGRNAPNEVMNFLFSRLLLQMKDKGVERFNLGMAPMAGFQEHEVVTAEEKAIHFFFQHLNFLFSYTGLRHFKAKFATSWEPRYVVYRNVLQLPELALALRAVSEARTLLA